MSSERLATEADEIGVLDLIVAIAESWIIILLVPIVFMGGAYFLTRSADTYSASALLSVAPVRVQAVLKETFPAIAVVPGEFENTTRISLTTDTSALAKGTLENAISILAKSPYLSEPDTEAELAAIAVWTDQAATLRRALEQVESRVEAITATDPGSYASAVTLLMTELATRERNLRKSAVRLALKVVVAPESVHVTVTNNSSSSGRTILMVGIAAGIVTVLTVLLGSALMRMDADAKGKISRIRRAFFIPNRNAN